MISLKRDILVLGSICLLIMVGCGGGTGGSSDNGSGSTTTGGNSSSSTLVTGSNSGTNTTGTTSGGTIPSSLTSIYSVDFERDSVGVYNQPQLSQDWGNTIMSLNGIVEGRVTVAQDSSKIISVKYPLGSCGPKDSDGCNKGGGAQWLMPLTQNYEELYLSYRVKFNSGFNFVLGGKLPGLTAGRDRLTMPPTGGTKPGSCDGFSARLMWKSNGIAETYLYSPAQPGNYGEDLAWQNPDGTPVQFIPGRWYVITQRLVMNTPGLYDGTLEMWLDGVKVQRKTNAFFRGEACPTLGVNQAYFSTFFGGSDSTWAAVKDEYVFFDDFVISRP